MNSPPVLAANSDGTQLNHIRGLDSIRALCALWVVFSHLGSPPLTNAIDKSNPLGWIAHGFYNNLWCGPAAVIVFFVISGFCIHYPFAKTLRIPSVGAYAVRRYLRVGIPLAVAAVFSGYLGVNLRDTVLWSLVAELVYYSIYPMLLAVRRRWVSWEFLIGVALLASIALAATNPHAKDYPSFGSGFAWLLGLPCWLLGCAVAERAANQELPATGAIWHWRLWVWGASAAASVLRFHSPLGYLWTLNLFAILVAYWLVREIEISKTHRPIQWLEWAGTWSYSLYLSHVITHNVYLRLGLQSLGPFADWSLKMALVVVGAFVFYLLVEYPSHLIARSCARFWTGPPKKIVLEP